MLLFDNDTGGGIELLKKLNPKYAPAFERYSQEQKASLAWYFLPHSSKKDTIGVTRPRVIKWYCPFADQKDFPSGHRYCVNVYAGCSHNCRYCYAQGYEPVEPKCKDNYKKKLLKDLSEIEEYNLPPAPLHLSNSTDPLQPLELKHQLTLYTLRQIVKYRRYFTTVTILTKNPQILTEPEYLIALKQLIDLPDSHPRKDEFVTRSSPALRVEVSVAFKNEQNAKFYDPDAPTIENRLAAIRTLRQNGIPVVLRIDPLLPRNPLPDGLTLDAFNLPNAQSCEALEYLVSFARDHELLHIVYSVAKVVGPRYKPMPDSMQRLKLVYEHLAAGKKLIFRGGSWRLPDNIAKTHITNPLLQICDKHNIKAYYCKQNLIQTL